MLKRVAAIDLGTNSFLCLIAEVEDGHIVNILHDTAQIVRLGQDVGQTKKFHPEALQRADDCLKEFSKIIKKQKPTQVLAMATAVARIVANTDDLFAIGKKYDIPIQIIPGEKEAQITFQGAVSAYPDDDVSRIIIDIGGGSTELIRGIGRKFEYGESIGIGAVICTEDFISEQPVSDIEGRALEKYLREKLEPVVAKMLVKKVDQLIAVAGTPTELAKIEIGKFDAKKIDGFKITLAQLQRYEDLFSNSSTLEKIQQLHVSDGRADIIYAGSMILRLVVELLGHNHIFVSTRGVRYGIALEMQ